MSQNRPYIDMLIEVLGLEPKQKETRTPATRVSVSKCLKCCWGTITGEVIFCPFTECMRGNNVFANALYGGSKHAEQT